MKVVTEVAGIAVAEAVGDLANMVPEVKQAKNSATHDDRAPTVYEGRNRRPCGVVAILGPRIWSFS